MFGSDRGGDHDIWAVNPDGSGLVNLTNHPGYDVNAFWAPDGQRIAFSTDRFAGTVDVAILDLRTNEVTRVTSGARQEHVVDWSPTGEWIAFLQWNGSEQDLAIVLRAPERAQSLSPRPP